MRYNKRVYDYNAGGVAVKINQVKFGAIMTYVSYALSVLLGLISTPMLQRHLGESEFGVYQLVLPVVSMLTVLTFGLGSVYTRYYSIYKTENDTDKMAKLNGLFIVMYSIIGAVAIAIGFGLAAMFESIFPNVTAEYVPLAKTLLRLMAINMGLSFPVYVFTSHIVVNEAYVFQKTVAALKMVLNPTLTMVLVVLGFRSVAVTVLAIALTVGVGIADIVYCFRRLKMPIAFGRMPNGFFKEILVFTSFVFLSNLVGELDWNSDRVILGMFAGSAAADAEVEVGLYSNPAQINIYFMSLATMLTNVFVPRAHRLIASKRPDSEVSDLFIKVGRWQYMMMITILIGFIAVGEGFMRYYTVYDPHRSYLIALLLMIPTIIPSVQNLGIEIQQAKNKHRFRAIAYAVVAVANIALSIPLAIRWGGVGAALGTAITTFVGKGLLMNWYYRRHIGLDIGRFWKEIGRITLAMGLPLAAAIAVAVFADTSTVGRFVLWGIPVVLVELVCLWFLAMTKADREQVAGPLLRRLKR
ncbi:MAG: teichoic acid transporter [Ruminococcaceae bacterium]|nr:teichoic acid transporter [Oscillospiraceae bacterium]